MTGLGLVEGKGQVEPLIACFRCGICCTEYQVNLSLTEGQRIADRLEPCQFGKPDAGMKQGQDDGPVTSSPPCVRRAEVEQGFDMLWREHWDNDGAYRGGVNVAHWASVRNALGHTPVEESP